MACERTPTDEVELNYDPRNPFDTCPMTFTPIYRSPPPPSTPPPFTHICCVRCTLPGNRSTFLNGSQENILDRVNSNPRGLPARCTQVLCDVVISAYLPSHINWPRSA